MFYMNEYDIDDAARQYRDHPVLGPATVTLVNLRDWTNSNSDGWAYWPKPARAAKKLMELVSDGTRFDNERPDATPELYAKALAPIKAFRTRQHAGFEIGIFTA